MNCPKCSMPVNWEGNDFRPFCSERCKMVDLGKWADEQYSIPGKKVDPSDIPEADNEDTDQF